MISYLPDTIISEMVYLIDYSCNSESVHTERFKTLHQAIIKKYFGTSVSDVYLDSFNKTVTLTFESDEGKPSAINYEFENLEDFLNSCLENDKRSLSFYQHTLTFYNILAA